MFRGLGGGIINVVFHGFFIIIILLRNKRIEISDSSKYLGNQIKLQTLILFACGKSLEI